MNKYKILKVLGEGSFGSAILAKDDETNELLVLKRIPIKKFSSAALSDAKKEVQVLSSLKHPHITQFFNCYELPEEIIIAMEYCGGGDLKTVIKQRGTVLFPQDRILDWFVQLCLAVKYIHDKHILHRDIKSQNIFLTEKGKIKLGDFGIAKTLDNSAAFTNTCVGTPYYISPEICQNMPYNSKSDVWALGCILYEMAALRHPFEASCMKVLITKIMNGSFSPIPSKFSWGFKVLIRQILKSNPNKRPSVTSILAKKILIERVPKFVKDIENNIELLAALRECEDLNDKIRKFSPYASSLSSPPKRKAYNSGSKKNFTPPKHYRRAAKLNSPKVLFSCAQQFNISRNESISKEIVLTSVENNSLTSVLPKTLENLLSDINNGRYGGFNQSPPKKLKIFRSQVQKRKKNKSKYNNSIAASSHNSDNAVSVNLVKSKENSKWHEFDHQESSIQPVKSLQTFLVPTSQINAEDDDPNQTNLRACEAAIFPTIGISKESIYSSTPMRRRRKAWSGWDPLPLGEITLETTRSQMDQTSTADEVLLYDIKALNRKSVGHSEIRESLTNFSVPSSYSIDSEINTRKQWNRDCVDVVNALCNAELLLDNTAATLCNTLHNEMSMSECDDPVENVSLTNVTADESPKENMKEESKGNVGNHDMCVEMIDNSNDSTMVDEERFFNNVLEEKTGEEDLNCSSLSPFVTVRKRSSGSHSITDKTFVISKQIAQNDGELDDNFSSFIEDFNTKEKIANQVGRELTPDIMKDETNVKDITEESSCLLTSAISKGFDNSILQDIHPNKNSTCPNASVEIPENISCTEYTNILNPISFEESCDNEVLHFNDSIDDEIEMKSKSGRSSLLKKLVRRYSNVKLVEDTCSSNKTLESGYGTTSQLNLSLSKNDSKLSTVELSTTGLLPVTETGVVDSLEEFNTKKNLTDDEMVCCEVSSSEKDKKNSSECADTVSISNIKEQEGMNMMHYFSPVCRSLPYNLSTSQSSVENPLRSLNLIDCGKSEVPNEQVDKPLVYKTKFNNDIINCDDSIIELSLTDSGKHFNLGPSSFINLGNDMTKADEDIYLSLDCCDTILSDRKDMFESISFTAYHEPDSDCCIIEDETYDSCTEDTFDNGNSSDDFKMSSDVLDVNCITLTFPDDSNLPGDKESGENEMVEKPKLYSLCMQSTDPMYSSTDNFEDIFGWIEEEKASLEQILGLESFMKYHSAASSAIESGSVGRFLSTFPLHPTEEGQGPLSRITAERIVNIVDAERAYDL